MRQWLLVGVVVVSCIYGLEVLVYEGADRARALRIVAGSWTAFLILWRVL